MFQSPYTQHQQSLMAVGLRATQQRIVIFAALSGLDNHPTAEQVYETIRPANPSISLGTVYKTLDTFVEKSLIRRVHSDDGFMRYDVHMEPHSHIYCTNTREIVDFRDPELEQLLVEFFSRKKIHNLKIKDISLQVNAEKINPDEKIRIE